MDWLRKCFIAKKNQCIMHRCFRKKYFGDVCYKHKCSSSDCIRAKFRNKSFCSRHCCSSIDCKLYGKYEFANTVNVVRVCHNHLCCYSGYPNLICSNINNTGTIYCGEHTCHYKECYSSVSPASRELLCEHHQTELNTGYITIDKLFRKDNIENSRNSYNDFRFAEMIVEHSV